MDRIKHVSRQNIIKTIVHVAVFLIMLAGIILWTKILPNSSFAIDNKNVNIEANIEKYINFNISDQDKGALVQYNVKTYIDYADSEQYIPIRQSLIKLGFNQIDNKYPYNVKVIAKSTESTNGKSNNIQEDYTYDKENGRLIIKASNEDQNGNLINTQKPNDNSKDEYIVICYYDAYTDQEVEREIVLSAEAIARIDENDEILTSQEEFKGTVRENIGELISTQYNTENISNGYIKSNIINGTEYDTQYRETQEILVNKKEAQDIIELSENNTFMTANKKQDGEEILTDIGNSNELVYSSTRIRKEDIVRIFGEEGKLEILDDNNNSIVVIDENTSFAEDGTITINYDRDLAGIKIRTSKIKNEGILRIENTKKIKNTMKKAANIKIKTTEKIIGKKEKTIKNQNKEEIIQEISFEGEKENIVNIEEAKDNVDFNISKTEWTNKEQNEISFDINLNANTIKDNMFKNPTIKIELPDEIEKVILEDSYMVYGNGLELQDVHLETDNNGKISIIANVIGSQSSYSDNALGLNTNIHIPAVIILKKDIESSIADLNLTYANEYTLGSRKEINSINKKIDIKCYNGESSAAENNEQSESVEESQANLYSRMREVLKANEDNQVVEGLTTDIKPVKGSTEIKNHDTLYEGEYIKYNITVKNTTDKNIDNVKVIYDIPEGTTYCELDADYHNYMGKYQYNYFDNVRTKEISIGTLRAGETYKAFYEVKVNDLEDNETEKNINTNIRTYVTDIETNSYDIENTIKQAELKVFLGAFLDNTADRWNYSLKVEGDENTEVQVKIAFPKLYELEYRVEAGGTEGIPSYLETDSNNVLIDTIQTNREYWYGGSINSENVRKNYDEVPIIFDAAASVDLNGATYNSNENRIEYEFKNVSIVMTSENEGEEVKFEDEINYEILIKNIGKTNLNEEETDSIAIDVEDYLPEKVRPISMEYEYYESTENGLLKKTGTKKLNKAKDNENNKIAEVDLTTNIPYGETIKIKVKTQAGEVLEKTKIENFATVKGEEINTKVSNTITHFILPHKEPEDKSENDSDDTDSIPSDSEKDTDDNSENNDKQEKETETNSKYSISGVAWVDENKDGQRQENEQKLGDVGIILINSQNSDIVSNNIKTDSNGEYKIDKIDKGQYIVAFEYDTQKYNVTEYHKSGIASNSNSDANSKQINIDGKSITVGLTDTINLEASVSDIDIGLIKNGICDIKLDKYISKVTVNTNKNVKQYSYNNEKLAKAEIKAKEIDGATVVVEYKILITNEGEIPTRVGSIIDYLPEGLTFVQQENSSWGMQKNAQLINNSLSNTIINPGESTSIPLVLTKQLTGNETGQFVNGAEIGNISNNLGISDKDSIPGNKVTSEDDYSEATLILSISTGEIIYIGIAIAGIVALLVILAILSKKGILKKKGIGKISKLIIFIVIFAGIIFTIEDSSWSSDSDKKLIAPQTLYFKFPHNASHTNKYGCICFYAESKSWEAHCQNAGVAATSGTYTFKKATSLQNASSTTSGNPTIELKKIDYDDRC